MSIIYLQEKAIFVELCGGILIETNPVCWRTSSGRICIAWRHEEYHKNIRQNIETPGKPHDLR